MHCSPKKVPEILQQDDIWNTKAGTTITAGSCRDFISNVISRRKCFRRK